MTALLEWEEARDRVVQGVDPLPTLMLPVLDALGFALSTDVVAPEDMPPFDNSAMDGFAVQASDVSGASESSPRVLRIVGTVPAGDPGRIRVGPSEAARIMTGAPIPLGADAVVPVESTDFWDLERDRSRFTDSFPERVTVTKGVSSGAQIRLRGESVRSGETALLRGKRLRSHDLALLVSLGVKEVSVHSLPSVTVLSTGDELVPPYDTPGPGQIRDSNRPGLLARLTENGFRPVDGGSAGDDAAEIETRILRASQSSDFLLTSGGVSVGDFDLTRRVLDRIGKVSAYRVAVKPGMPQVFGRVGRTPVFGLPGNPVSSLVVFDQFVLPALKKMAGRRIIYPPLFFAALGSSLTRKPGRVEFMRVRLETENGAWIAFATGPQGSGVLSSLSKANGYAVLPREAETLEAGTPVLCQRFEHE